MREHRELKLTPDWPRIRQLVAKGMGKTENEVQAMRESGDSLDCVQLGMAIEEVMHRLSK